MGERQPSTYRSEDTTDICDVNWLNPIERHTAGDFLDEQVPFGIALDVHVLVRKIEGVVCVYEREIEGWTKQVRWSLGFS
ncbi:unnamed protein product [Caretta caretta]